MGRFWVPVDGCHYFVDFRENNQGAQRVIKFEDAESAKKKWESIQSKQVNKYPFISDTGAPFQAEIQSLIHDTDEESAESIKSEKMFKAKHAKQLGRYGEHHLSWWGVYTDFKKPPENTDTPDESNSLTNAMSGLNLARRSYCFKSDQLRSNYGDRRFECQMNDLIKTYAESREFKIQNVCLRILGTFLYKQEIMYTILVCQQK
jgi:hypothetical protein